MKVANVSTYAVKSSSREVSIWLSTGYVFMVPAGLFAIPWKMSWLWTKDTNGWRQYHCWPSTDNLCRFSWLEVGELYWLLDRFHVRLRILYAWLHLILEKNWKETTLGTISFWSCSSFWRFALQFILVC